jgi:hypothetical protein
LTFNKLTCVVPVFICSWSQFFLFRFYTVSLHSVAIHAAVLWPNAETITTACGDGVVRFWKEQLPQQRAQEQPLQPVWDVVGQLELSPLPLTQLRTNSRELCVADASGRIHVLDEISPVSGRVLGAIRERMMMPARGSKARSVGRTNLFVRRQDSTLANLVQAAVIAKGVPEGSA